MYHIVTWHIKWSINQRPIWLMESWTLTTNRETNPYHWFSDINVECVNRNFLIPIYILLLFESILISYDFGRIFHHHPCLRSIQLYCTSGKHNSIYPTNNLLNKGLSVLEEPDSYIYTSYDLGGSRTISLHFPHQLSSLLPQFPFSQQSHA